MQPCLWDLTFFNEIIVLVFIGTESANDSDRELGPHQMLTEMPLPSTSREVGNEGGCEFQTHSSQTGKMS